MRSNCLFFALHRFWRDGGYVVMRRSRHNSLWPHFLWTENLLCFLSFEAIHGRRLLAWFPFYFSGYIKPFHMATPYATGIRPISTAKNPNAKPRATRFKRGDGI